MDWNEIKTEYITTETSYRKLCDKHGVSLGKLQNRATEEKWPELKKQFMTECVTKSVNAVTNGYAQRATRVLAVADKLLRKIEITIDNIDGVHRGSRAVKDVSDALKNVRDIMMIKSDLDIREQEARIDKLRKDTEEEDTGKQVTVRILGGDESWRQ